MIDTNRLRDVAERHLAFDANSLVHDAANEIENLRAEIECLIETVHSWTYAANQMADERDELLATFICDCGRDLLPDKCPVCDNDE